MKVAYIIITHKNPTQLVRLIDRLDSDGVSFLLHISKNSEKGFYEKTKELLKNNPKCEFLKREVIYWGHFGIIKATLNGFDQIQNKDVDFTVILSGQDYPLKSHQEIINTLSSYKDKQLLEYAQFPWEDKVERWERYHFVFNNKHFVYPPYNDKGKLFSLGNSLLSPFITQKRDFPSEYVPYGGSFWCCLSKNALEYILAFIKSAEGKRLLNFFRFTHIPDEMFFQTVLLNSNLKNSVINDNLRFIDFKDDSSNPNILLADDFSRLANSNKLFARKFDSDIDAEILDMVDEKLLTGTS